MPAPPCPKPATRLTPWLQAGRLAFMGLYGVAALAACAWVLSNVREVAPGNRAVVLRFGAIERVQDSGLLIAWPAPIEEVVDVPSPEHVLEWQVQTQFWVPPGAAAATETAAPSYGQEAQEELEGGNIEDEAGDDAGQAAGNDRDEDTADVPALNARTSGSDGAGTGYLLSGDAGVVQLGIRFFFHVEDPKEFVLQGQHVEAALDRLAARSAIAVCAERDLDGILVARPELVGSEGDVAEQRERLRGDFVRDLDARLAALKQAGLGLGVKVDRADIQSMLPREATDAFDAVLTASQEAEREVAGARNDAARTAQAAAETANHTVQAAQAQADEAVAKAKADTASILSLAEEPGSRSDPNLLLRLFRERIPAILARAGGTTLVQPGDDAHLILQGSGR